MITHRPVAGGIALGLTEATPLIGRGNAHTGESLPVEEIWEPRPYLKTVPRLFAHLREQLGDEIPNMLPKGAGSLDARSIAEIDEWFGPEGKFPAVMISSHGGSP